MDRRPRVHGAIPDYIALCCATGRERERERGGFISSLRSPSPPSPIHPLPCNRCKFHYWPTDSAALNSATRVYRLLSAFIRSSKRCLSPSSVAWLFLRTERKGYSRCRAKEKEQNKFTILFYSRSFSSSRVRTKCKDKKRKDKKRKRLISVLCM